MPAPRDREPLGLGRREGDRPKTPATERQKTAAEAAGGGAEVIGEFLRSSAGRSLTRQVVRGVFDLPKKR